MQTKYHKPLKHFSQKLHLPFIKTFTFIAWNTYKNFFYLCPNQWWNYSPTKQIKNSNLLDLIYENF
jgi:hypothetical protein